MAELKMMCAHGLAPEQTEKSLEIPTTFIGPMPMEKQSDGSWRCPCGFQTEGPDAPASAGDRLEEVAEA